MHLPRAHRHRKRGFRRQVIVERGGPRAEARQPAVVIVTCAAERDLERGGDLPEAHLLKARQLQRQSLAFRQLRQSCMDHPSALVPRQGVAIVVRGHVDVIERFTAVGRTQAECGLATQASVICVLHQPDAYSASGGIVQVRLSINLQEDFLRDVFGLGGIAQDANRDALNETPIATNQCFQCISVHRLDVCHQVRISAGCGEITANLVDRRAHRWEPRSHASVVLNSLLIVIDGFARRRTAVHNRVCLVRNQLREKGHLRGRSRSSAHLVLRYAVCVSRGISRRNTSRSVLA